MNYTKGEGEWEVFESPFAPAVIVKDKPNRPNKIIAICKLEGGSEGMTQATANANLIAAAVNGCISVNPNNPHAVAETIKDMYEALKVALNETPGFMLGEDVKQIMKQALAKAEGRAEK